MNSVLIVVYIYVTTLEQIMVVTPQIKNHKALEVALSYTNTQ